METEGEIKTILERAIASDGEISSTVIETLEWVLDIEKDEYCSSLLLLEDKK